MPIILFKLLEPAKQPLAGPSCLERIFGAEKNKSLIYVYAIFLILEHCARTTSTSFQHVFNIKTFNFLRLLQYNIHGSGCGNFVIGHLYCRIYVKKWITISIILLVGWKIFRALCLTQYIYSIFSLLWFTRIPISPTYVILKWYLICLLLLPIQHHRM